MNLPSLTVCSNCGSKLVVPNDRAKRLIETPGASAQTTLLFERRYCPNCGHANPQAAPICANCGHQLELGIVMDLIRARQPRQNDMQADLDMSRRIVPVRTTDEVKAARASGGDPFRSGMRLRLDISGGTAPIILQPAREMVMGRHDPAASSSPDIDLTAYAAYRLGVSRRHAALRLEDHVLDVRDLGSSNGTYVNGVRLAPHQPRPLRSGDELGLGNLRLWLQFLPEEK